MFGRTKNGRPATRGRLVSGGDALHAGLLRGTGASGMGLASQERFRSTQAIAEDDSLAFSIKNPEAKLFLGAVGGSIEQRGKSRHVQGGRLVGVSDDRHAMIVAGSRAGKGRSLLLPILATWPGPAIVIDPKLDLATDTAALRAKRLDQTVLVLDPFGIGGAGCDPYRASGNPLTYQLGGGDDDLIDLATLIADGLVVPSEGKEPHWDESARMFVEAVILHVLTCPKYEGRRTLNTVHDLLTHHVEDGDDDNLASLEVEMCENEALDGAVASGAACYYDRESRERGSVLSTIRRHLHFLTYPKIQRALTDGPIDVRELAGSDHKSSKPTTLYLGLPATKMRSCAGLPRLFINLALAAFEASSNRRAFQTQSGGCPCLIVMDEFFSLGRMERVAAAAGQVAGFGVKLLPVLQDLNQLQALYPSSWQTFAANAGVMSFFGNQDLATLEFLEKRLGQTQIANPSQSDTAYNAAVREGATGSSFSIGSHPLMSISEIARTFDRDDPYRRQLVLSARHGPMILQRAFYDQHEAFRGMFDVGR